MIISTSFPRLAGFVLSCLLALPGLSRAEQILPVAEGRFSVVVTLEPTTARPAAGAWVEFIGEPDTGIPRQVGAVGFVLGTRNDVVFVEVSEREAETLALARQTQNVRFQQIADPDPDAVAERRAFRDAGQAVTLAPRLRTIALPVVATAEFVETWTPGGVLTFPNLSADIGRPSLTGVRARSGDVDAMFVSARQTGPSRFDVTVVAEPRDAFALLRTATRQELTVAPHGTGAREAPDEPTCHIRHRRGTDIMRVAIPCD